MNRYLCLTRGSEGTHLNWFIGDDENHSIKGGACTSSQTFKDFYQDLLQVQCISGFNLESDLEWLSQQNDQSLIIPLQIRLNELEKIYLSRPKR